MKILFVMLDGLPDKTNAKNPRTPLEVSAHPNLDSLVKCGLLGNVDYKIKLPDTDVCTLKALGYTENPGRGFIDALGAGVPVHDDWIYLRCNFANVDNDGNITDRRAGRDSYGLDQISSRLNGIEIEDVKFHVFHEKNDSHRFVIAMEGKGLSSDVKPNDSKQLGKYKQISWKTEKAKKTSRILNAFLNKSREILLNHPVNSKRKVPANAILIRNTGKYDRVTMFQKKYKLRGKCIAFVLTVKGVARLLGMDIETPHGATGDTHTNIKSKFDAAMKAFDNHDFVLLHLDGADIAAHDGNFNEKVRFIDRLDNELFSRIKKDFDLTKNILIVTSDHITETGKYHAAGPVPFLMVGKDVKSNNMTRFTEKIAQSGKKISNTLLDKII